MMPVTVASRRRGSRTLGHSQIHQQDKKLPGVRGARDGYDSPNKISDQSQPRKLTNWPCPQVSECGCNSRSTRNEPAYQSTPRTRTEVYYDTGGSSPRGTLPLNLDSDREPLYRPSRSHGHRSLRSSQQTYDDPLPRSTSRHDSGPDNS